MINDVYLQNCQVCPNLEHFLKMRATFLHQTLTEHALCLKLIQLNFQAVVNESNAEFISEQLNDITKNPTEITNPMDVKFIADTVERLVHVKQTLQKVCFCREHFPHKYMFTYML